jgi:hypothetical protein
MPVSAALMRVHQHSARAGSYESKLGNGFLPFGEAAKLESGRWC